LKAHSDSFYIQALLDGDPKIIGSIYDLYANKIRSFVCANSGTVDDARDVFQEALISITRQARRNGFVLTCPFGAFLYLVCRGKWLNELKRRRRQAVTLTESGGFEGMEEAFEPAESTLLEAERDRLFQQCFERLAEGCRQLLQLSWTDLSMEEVGQKLNFTYAYVRKRKHECLAKLSALIQASPEYALLK
jgi:RNA polymerase sigma factor (sigma-70 family)